VNLLKVLTDEGILFNALINYTLWE